MRALILTILYLAGPGANLARGAAPSLKVGTSVRAEKGATGAVNEGVAEASSLTATTDLSSGSALGALTLRMGYDQQRPAYERVVLTDRQGNTRPLSASHPGPEHAVRAGADLTLPALVLSLDGSHTAGRSAFPGFKAGLQAVHDRYASGTRLSAALSRSDYSSPQSFFIDPDTFRTRERPGRLLETELRLGAEQALTERTRGRLEALYASRPSRRPGKTGLEASYAWAFHDDKALVATLGGARELRSGALHDERGYLDAAWLQAELRYEPSYAWRLFARAGTMLETETARGRLRRQKVGTDSLGLEARRVAGRLELGLSTLAAFSNSGYRNLQLGGNLSWQL